MKNEENNEVFSYTYSSEQQKEIENIRKKYAPRAESKMEYLRRLDKSAEKPGTITSIIVGIIGALLLGVSMCCVTEWQEFFAVGIGVGIIGIALIIAAYPLFKNITKKQREKIAPEIIRLTDELSK